MKTIAVSAVVAALLASNVAAYPGMMGMDRLTAPLAEQAYKNRNKRQVDAAAPQGVGALPLTPPPFDAASQYVSNTGAYAVRLQFII